MWLRHFHKAHKAGSRSLVNLPSGKPSGNSNTRDSHSIELWKGKMLYASYLAIIKGWWLLCRSDHKTTSDPFVVVCFEAAERPWLGAGTSQDGSWSAKSSYIWMRGWHQLFLFSHAAWLPTVENSAINPGKDDHVIDVVDWDGDIHPLSLMTISLWWVAVCTPYVFIAPATD